MGELVERLRARGNRYDHGAMMHGELLNPDGPEAADRYKALGNSMAVPCMRWIGERIAMVDAIAQPKEP